MAKHTNRIPKQLRRPVKRLVDLHLLLEEEKVKQVYAIMAETGMSLNDLFLTWLATDLAAREGQFPTPEAEAASVEKVPYAVTEKEGA